METKMKILTTYFFPLVLICILTTDLTFSASNNSDTKTIHEKSFQILPGKKLILNTDAGDIQITPWNKSEVAVKVIGNENAADKFKYNFNSTSEEVIIEADKKGGLSWLLNVNLKFEIKVPTNFNIYANTAGGDIKIGGVKGDINLKTSGGDIWGDRFEGKLDAKTSGGDINLFSSNAKIEANTSGGDIELEYTGINQGIDLKTSGGDIEVKVPENFNAKAELKTSGGDVDCNLTLNSVNKLTETKIDANINKGGKPLIAVTSGGDVTINKK